MPVAHLQANEGGADAEEVEGLVGEQGAGDAVLLDGRVLNNHLLGCPTVTACALVLDMHFLAASSILQSPVVSMREYCENNVTAWVEERIW